MKRYGRSGIAIAASVLFVALCLALSACGTMVMESADDGGETLEERVASGLSVQAQRGSKDLTINRASLSGKRPSGIEKDSWTVFVYLCGSDLETRGGAATADLGEMVGAIGSENVRFVVETGGAKEWHGKQGSGRNLDRYVVQDGSITSVGSVKTADMGDPNTLADFLTWGLKNYPAEHMGVIMWDHGGGSITGVCFDERNGYDSLMLRELDHAFARTSLTMWQKFDFVGFDACLMGTLETANILATYADYMVASQEVEPGTGWEYSSIMEYLAQNPGCTAKELGQAICDGYMESLPGSRSSSATLSVIDLSQMDGLMQDFYGFSQEMYETGSNQADLAAMTRGIRRAESYGTNNRMEGYTNMVDLGGIVDACAATSPSAEDVRKTLAKAVTYQINGRNHAGSSGLSLYYPLSIRDSKELTAYETVAANQSYLSYVDRLAHGATYNGGTEYTSYTNDSWYDSDGLWSLLTDEETLSLLIGAVSSMRSVDPHWEYVDEHDPESKLVTFASEPQVDDEGVYWMQFDKHGVDNVASVAGLVYRQAEGGDAVELGQTYEVWAEWNEGEDQGLVEDGFDGKWLSLPDGQNLCLYVVENKASENSDLGEVVFTSPIRLNGEDCYLRMTQNLETGKVEVEGAWTGEGDNGLVNRNCIPIAKGDKVVPLYGTDRKVEGNEFTVSEDALAIEYKDLPKGTYLYSFDITDVFGDRFITDQVQFDIEEDGIYFVE